MTLASAQYGGFGLGGLGGFGKLGGGGGGSGGIGGLGGYGGGEGGYGGHKETFIDFRVSILNALTNKHVLIFLFSGSSQVRIQIRSS